MVTEAEIGLATAFIQMLGRDDAPEFQGYARVADCELAVHSDGDGQLVHRDDIDLLVAGHQYVINWYWHNSHDEPTAEPVDGNAGPRFGARNQCDEWWRVLDPVELIEYKAAGL